MNNFLKINSIICWNVSLNKNVETGRPGYKKGDLNLFHLKDAASHVEGKFIFNYQIFCESKIIFVDLIDNIKDSILYLYYYL